jgi:hypothetical protein
MIYLDNRESVSSADSYLFYRSLIDKGTHLPSIDKNELILTQSTEIKQLFPTYDVRFLSEYLGVRGDMGLYELFSIFFDGKVQDDFDMIETLFKGFLIESDWCFCLKIGVTFCWFSISDKKLHKLGTMQFSEPISKYTVGRFIKRLRFSIVKSGVNLNKIKFLCWNKNDLGYEFSGYITKYDCLDTFFSSIEGLKNLDVESVMHFLSKENKVKYIITAENFVNCLNDSFDALKLYQKDGVLYSRSTYYKDYSTCISPIVNQSDCSYGLIIDCEGKSGGNIEDGCREIGGLIYCKYSNILVSVNTFACDELLLEDTLLQVFSNYKENTGGKLSNIQVLTFGKSDEKMLQNSIVKVCSKKNARFILNKLVFIDCMPFVLSHTNTSDDSKSTLSNIARSLGVMPVFPKHKPVNDARTLFNILACILNDTGKFIRERKE